MRDTDKAAAFMRRYNHLKRMWFSNSQGPRGEYDSMYDEETGETGPSIMDQETLARQFANMEVEIPRNPDQPPTPLRRRS